MSQSGMNLKNMKMPAVSSGMIGGVVFFIVILTVLYYVYTFLYTSQGVQASSNIIPTKILDAKELKQGGVIRCDAAKPVSDVAGDSAVAQFVNATGLTSGGQYTVTMWLSVYSTTPQTAGTATIPLLDISSSAKTLLFVGLTPTNGTLVVHQGTGEQGKDGIPDRMGGLNTAGGSPYSGSDKCNIVNGIEYQRWILVGVVATGRTLDVYIDGKLSRSCVYSGTNDLGVTTGTGTITVGRQNARTGKINGVFSTTEYYNYAITPDIMWSIYQNGPATASSGNFLSSMFSTSIDLSMGTAAK